jgi:hypothetical protein
MLDNIRALIHWHGQVLEYDHPSLALWLYTLAAWFPW